MRNPAERITGAAPVIRLGGEWIEWDTQEWLQHECLEGEVFDTPDGGGDEDEDKGEWTPEACWTERWAPIGRAARLLDEVQVRAHTFDPDEYIDSF